jgi:hypothetical protein
MIYNGCPRDKIEYRNRQPLLERHYFIGLAALGFKLFANGEFEEIFNGPGSLISDPIRP